MKIAILAEGTRQPGLLKTLALVALFTARLAGAALELPDIFSYRAQDLAALRAGFAQPPREAAPWVYWFWWGNVVSREEIARELEELAAAGFGGAEIRIATFHGWGGKPLASMDAANLERLGHRKLTYLSDEWVDVMEFTCAKARQLGLRLAINLGQGWPPGGPWITDAQRTKHLSWKSQEVEGPRAFSSEDLPAEGMVFAWKLADPGQVKAVATNSFQDITGLIQRQGTRRTLSWEVPAGRWLVGIFAVTPGGTCDKGEGPEVDPASREAVLFHLNYMFSRLDPKLRRFYGTTLVDAASDSWEYEAPPRGTTGRFWSPAIVETFPKLAGYDLREKMFALLGYGPERERVLHDLEEVERQLVRENYFQTIAQFLHQRGLRHRPQIYGRGLKRDLLEAYLYADTPEVEQGDWCVPEGIWTGRTIGRPVISCEAFTHLHLKMGVMRRPHGEWESNPAAMRGAANYLFGEGINRVQMHSFSYSPPGLPLPGWRMYAELHLNRNVPWWPAMPALNTWLARQQWLLQAGSHVADALVYPVESNPDDGPFRTMGDRQPVSAANAVDVANAFTLPVVARALAAGVYEANHLLLLDALKTPAEVQTALAFLDHGARVVCTHSLPEAWPALQAPEAAAWRERFNTARTNGMVLDATTNGWKAAVAEARSARWTPADAQLVFQHRRVLGGEIYLLFNYGDDFRGEVSLPHSGQRVDRFDADTGGIMPVGQVNDRKGWLVVPLALDHGESAAFVVSPTRRPVHVTRAPEAAYDYDGHGRLRARFAKAGEYSQIRLSDGTGRDLIVAMPDRIAVPGPWRLSVSATQAVSPRSPIELTLPRLVSWRELPELKYYAGRATYRAEVDMPAEWIADDFGWFLDLGEVYELGRVSINGQQAGTAYTPPFRVDVTPFLEPGRNTLEIEVPNQLKNHLEKSAAYPRPSGLLGPVRLVPERRITLANPRGPFAPPAAVQQTNVFVSGEGGYHTYRIPALIETRPGTLLHDMLFAPFFAGAAEARSFLETGLSLFTNDNTAQRVYRLPSLLVTGKGTVIAASQLRWGPDDFAAQELVCRRSEDGGRTWGPELSIYRHPERNQCMFNGCIVEDAEARKLILHFLQFPANQGRQWFPNVFFPRGGGHCQTESTDDGKAWSEPILQFPSANADGWKGASSLNNNHGVQIQHGPHRGRLVMNARVFKPGRATQRGKGGIVYSDDHGRTWRIGGVPFPENEWYQTESCLVETAGGGIYVNYRNESGDENQPRLYHRSDDGGQMVSQQGSHRDLPSMVCNAGMTRYSWSPQNIILLTMPASAGRRDLTCFASFDDGRTWPVRRRITSDGGYSDLAVSSDGTILVAYERDGARKGIVLARFNLAWLLEKQS